MPEQARSEFLLYPTGDGRTRIKLSEAATCKDYLQVRTEGRRAVAWNLSHDRLEADARGRGVRADGERIEDPATPEKTINAEVLKVTTQGKSHA